MRNNAFGSLLASLAVLILAFAALPSAAAPLITELKPETVQAFNAYVKVVETMMQKRITGEKPFLWMDDDPRNRMKIRSGEIVTQRLDDVDAQIPSGLVHNWIGAMFVPGGTLQAVVAVMQDFSRHSEIYPEVLKGRLLKQDGDRFSSYLRLVKKKVLTVTLDSEYDATYEKIGEKRMFVRSHSTKIAQVENAGKPNEEILPVGKDSGFLWRLNAYWRLEQVDDGVFVELATVSLTRDIPTGLGWMIKPFITSIPQESLVSTLQATRLEVKKLSGE